MNAMLGSVELSTTSIVMGCPCVGPTAYTARESSGLTQMKRRHSGMLMNCVAFWRIFNASCVPAFVSWLNLIASIAIIDRYLLSRRPSWSLYSCRDDFLSESEEHTSELQ